ncbi:hypothetical protein ACFLZ5_11650 [Thermodesulfobacteriota bacterium]
MKKGISGESTKKSRNPSGLRLIYMVPKAGLEPARAWPTTPSM